jgi:cell wall-associated NlpC family hydrolase
VPSLERPTEVVRVEHFGRGQAIAQACPGDFVLVRGRGWISMAVYAFQGLRFRAPGERRYAYWSHVALVTSARGRLVEVGPRGVFRNTLETYRTFEYHYVHVAASGARRAEAARFAESCVGQPYGTLSSIALGFFALVGCPLAVPDRGQHNCAALVARALERATGERFTRTPINMMPADIAKHFGITP